MIAPKRLAILCWLIIVVSLLFGCGTSEAVSTSNDSSTKNSEPSTTNEDSSAVSDDSTHTVNDSSEKANITPKENEGDLSSQIDQTEDIIENSGEDIQMPSIEDAKDMDPITTSGDIAVGDDAGIDTYFSKAENYAPGEEIHADGIANISFSDTYWSEKIEPKNPQGSYGYIDEVEGYKFFIAEGKFENLQENEVFLDTVQTGSDYAAVIQYNEEYYIAKLAAANEDDSSITTRIAPNQKVTVYMFAMIPADAYKEDTTANILLGFSDFQETINTGFGSNPLKLDACTYLYSAKLS